MARENLTPIGMAGIFFWGNKKPLDDESRGIPTLDFDYSEPGMGVNIPSIRDSLYGLGDRHNLLPEVRKNPSSVAQYSRIGTLSPALAPRNSPLAFRVADDRYIPKKVSP